MVRLGGGKAASPGVELGKATEVVAYHSSSKPGTFHFTFILEQPAIFKRFGGEVTILCTCPGFHNHRKCWHIAATAGDDIADSED